MDAESINNEIRRFESVHPSIYGIYELLESISELPIANSIREHVVSIEDSFVNSQEWTLSRDVKEIRIGVVGDLHSEKSSLVHRYITGTFLHDDSPDGGRFKKELTVGNRSYLLLIRDEADYDQIDNLNSSLYHWIHCLIVVSNSTPANSVVSNIKTNVPVLLVAICTHGTDFVDSFTRIHHDAFAQINHWGRDEIDYVFTTATQLALNQMNMMNVIQNDKKVSSTNTPLSITPISTPIVNRRLRRRSNLFNNSCKSLGVGRTIPLKQGTLYKKTDKSKRWKKKYVILLHDEMIYFPSINDYMENSNGKTIKLINTCVKPSTGLTKTGMMDSKNLPGFTLTTIEKKIYEFEVESFEELESWLKLMQEVILDLIQHSGLGTNNNIDKILLERIKRLPGNDYCVDCGNNNPMWTCINNGTLVCIRCSGIHRQLGTHISRIRSLQLDEFTREQLEMLLMVGNQVFNNVYGGVCPNPDPEAIQGFIKDKYVLKKYVRSTNLKELKEALSQHNVEGVIRYVANSNLPFSKEIESTKFACIQAFDFDVFALYQTSRYFFSVRDWRNFFNAVLNSDSTISFCEITQ